MACTVDIAMIADDNYVLPTLVAINSVYINKNAETFYRIHILANAISKENKFKLESCTKENFEIEVLDKSEIIEKFPKVVQKRHVSSTAILKIFLPKIFYDLEKLLYLDSDIIVQKDLSELFSTDISEYYAGAVKDVLTINNKKHMKKLQIKRDYFNSGVLLLNLKKIREENVQEKLIEYRINGYNYFMDQDTFNIVFDKVKYLSWKNNFLNYYLEKTSIKKLEVFFGETFPENDIYTNCTIVHFGGHYKPWEYNLDELSELYNKYIKGAGIEFSLKNLKTIPKENKIKKFLEKFYSVKSSNDKRYTIIQILGIKFKIKNKG